MKLVVGLGNPGEKYAKTRHNAGWIVLDWFVEGNRHPELVSGSGRSGSSRFRNKFGMTNQQVKTSTFSRDVCWLEKKKLKAFACRSSDVIYAKPLTFMNSSGEAVRKLVDYFSRHPELDSGSRTSKMPKRVRHDRNLENLLVIHDDLDLPLGEYRLQKGRGAAGHKGVQSVIDCVDSQDFWRLRIGIGCPRPGNHNTRHPELVSGSGRPGPSRFRIESGMTKDDETPEAEYVLQNFSKEELKVLEELFEKKLLSELHNWL